MRVYLDTNVLISGLVARGLCSDVVRICMAEYCLVVAECVLSEVEEKLTGKFEMPDQIVDEFLSLLREHEVVADAKDLSGVDVRDPDDNVVLATAIRERVDIVITGDKDLLEVASEYPVKILSPRQFIVLHSKLTRS